LVNKEEVGGEGMKRRGRGGVVGVLRFLGKEAMCIRKEYWKL